MLPREPAELSARYIDDSVLHDIQQFVTFNTHFRMLMKIKTKATSVPTRERSNSELVAVHHQQPGEGVGLLV